MKTMYFAVTNASVKVIESNNMETFWDVSTKAVSTAVLRDDLFVHIYMIYTIYSNNVFISVSFLPHL